MQDPSYPQLTIKLNLESYFPEHELNHIQIFILTTKKVSLRFSNDLELTLCQLFLIFFEGYNLFKTNSFYLDISKRVCHEFHHDTTL